MVKKKIFNFFRNAMDEAVEEEKVNIDDAIVEIEGQQVPLSEVIQAYKEEMAEEKASQEAMTNNVINPDDEIDVDGEKILASNLIAAYQKRASKANADVPTNTTAEPVVDEALQKENSKPNQYFKTLDNSIKNSLDGFKLIIQSKDERVQKGTDRYGSGKGVK